MECIDTVLTARNQRAHGLVAENTEACLNDEAQKASNGKQRAFAAIAHLQIVRDALNFIREARYRATLGNQVSFHWHNFPEHAKSDDRRAIEQYMAKWKEIYENPRMALTRLDSMFLEEIEKHFQGIIGLCNEFERLYEGEILLAERLR